MFICTLSLYVGQPDTARRARNRLDLQCYQAIITSNPYVLITLNNQFTSNEYNSASWNGLQAVFLSNFINKGPDDTLKVWRGLVHPYGREEMVVSYARV